MYVYMCGCQRLMSNVFFNNSTSSLLRQGLTLNPEAIDELGWLDSKLWGSARLHDIISGLRL